jgi:hypothetical protein
MAAAAFVVLGGGTVAVAGGADGGPSATTASKKSVKRVGFYRGTTELGKAVSFRFTKKRKVVGFTISNMEVTCTIMGPDPPLYNKPPYTIKAPPMKLQGVARFKHEDPKDVTGPWQGTYVDGKIDGGAGGGTHPPGYVNTHMKGNAEWLTWNGPFHQAGTEFCGTEGDDWEAKKVGK